ncbi:hypothetical protein BDD12DRAFT_211594 [Trichophaea hybrida]|nr:hypothetical protein BDD12DRAFT_211594 [Trichophaea hybrida]
MTSDIKAIVHSTVKKFLECVSEPLHQREWQNAIPLGIYPNYLSPTQTPPRLFPDKEGEDQSVFILLSTSSDSGVCLVSCKTPSYGSMSVYSTVDPDTVDLAAHVAVLLDALFKLPGKVPRAYNGDVRLSWALAAAVAARLGLSVKTESRCTGAVLTATSLSSDIPRSPLSPQHVVKKVTAEEYGTHSELLVTMYSNMFLEVRGQGVPMPVAQGVVENGVAAGHVWAYFVEGVPVSGAFLGRPTRRGKSITCVYARKEFRGRGNTQALMDTLCKVLLEEEGLGYLTIFFEEGGSAGRIYRRVGFGKEGEYVMADFTLIDENAEEDGGKSRVDVKKIST